MVSTEGSWEAGKAGAKPGIIMQAHPKVGQTYRQEYYKGVAEDMAKVIDINGSAKVPYGFFDHVLGEQGVVASGARRGRAQVLCCWGRRHQGGYGKGPVGDARTG